MRDLFFKTLAFTMSAFLLSLPLSGQEQDRNIVTYDDFIKHIKDTLPEIKSNKTDVLIAENDIKKAKSAGDITVDAGGEYSSQEQYNITTGSCDVSTSTFYAGLSKKLIPTGTKLSTEFNYAKTSYSNFSTISDYTTYEPSVSFKISQPILYNFLGKVDKYSEKNAEMQLEIENVKFLENNKSVLNAYKKLYFEWILYKKLLNNLNESIQNSKTLEAQIKRQVKAGLSDNDDFQKAVTSTLSFESKYEEYSTALAKIENEIELYLNMKFEPVTAVFKNLFNESYNCAYNNVNFSSTNSARLMDLTMKNLNYTKEVSENQLLPELNVYTQLTRKNISDEAAAGLDKTDYSIGFEFTYNIGNNSAESDLREAEIRLQDLNYEYKSTLNTYKKKLSEYNASAAGTKKLLKNAAKVLGALESQLKTEQKKYKQARLNLSYVIETENSIATKKIEIMELKYSLIENFIDFMDLVN
ncbi:MAG: TolC family protein [Spirochaetes bacterium]|nr:TolC family protein [Spirochaetota bacterium]